MLHNNNSQSTSNVFFYTDDIALQLIFNSLKNQNYRKFEVVISEDGQSKKIRDTVNTMVRPATKITQIFLYKIFKQKRSQIKNTGYEYNLHPIKYFVETSADKPVKPVEPPSLAFGKKKKFSLGNELVLKSSIRSDTRIIFKRPATGGSAINLSLKQYVELAINLSAHKNTYAVITASPDDLAIATESSLLLKEIKQHTHHSTDGIINFCKTINLFDVFINRLAGPLHIAGALNLSTVTFYPAQQSATSLRWMTLNTVSKRIGFTISDKPVNLNIKVVVTSIFNKFLDQALCSLTRLQPI